MVMRPQTEKTESMRLAVANGTNRNAWVQSCAPSLSPIALKKSRFQ